MKLIEKYLNAKQAIYDHVGLVADWVVCPIDPCLEMYWKLETNISGNPTNIIYHETKESVINEDGNHYQDDIYTQRHYNKHVYEGEDFTLVFCDPHVDGMKWWRLMDNKKRIK